MKSAFAGIALLAIVSSSSAIAQDRAPIIRTVTGLRFEIPDGWEWTRFDGYQVSIQHVATKVGAEGSEKSPNAFNVGGRSEPDEDFDKSWEELDRSGRQSYPNGATARWRAGPKRSWGHYHFAAEATIGTRVVSVSILDHVTPRFDVGLVESAFLQIAKTLKDVPETARVLFHPTLGIAADYLRAPWFTHSDRGAIRFVCQADERGCGPDGRTVIHVYPADKSIADVRLGLADITGYFEKRDSLGIGTPQRLALPGGELQWTEQPGTHAPFLGVFRCDGRYFFVSMFSESKRKRSHDILREDLLAVVKGVRGWDSQ